ncbi:hypothetical protein ASJ80_08105 [Methanobacterium bryantii]|uniref:Uncharacterized protein n=1 Tax=Methanobacterium bryantii TaxID=2161 RepID=A0A2A2H8P7_METBR|nr:hypothetical protein ASJ80_08105 [Methanobacterium bryantii]
MFTKSLKILKNLDFWALEIHRISGHVKTFGFYGCEACFTNTENLYKNFRVFRKSQGDFLQPQKIHRIFWDIQTQSV